MTRLVKLLGPVALVVALGACGTPAPAAAAGAGAGAGATSAGRLDARIARLARHHPHQVVEAIVQFSPAVPAPAARRLVIRAGGRVVAALHIIPALAARLPAAGAATLAAQPGIRAVSLNGRVASSRWSGNAAGAPSAGDLQTTYDRTLGVPALWRAGITGAGVGVAVIDTGIDGALPDFRSRAGASRVVATAVVNPAAQTAGDGYGHGTDVAGIIAGNGDARDRSDPLRGQYVGVAPGANLISIKASDEAGNATVLDVIYGLQFAVDHRAQYNIRVVNLSLDAATPQSYRTDPLDAAAESAWMHGIVVVAAAGNRGTAADAVQYAPANDPYVITVGATDEGGTPEVADDVIAPWSSRGTTQDGFAKPDVYAPGAHIASVLAPGSAFAGMCSDCIIDGQYIRTSGTSMAAPMISGIVADLLQARPQLSPDEVKAMLTAPGALSRPSGLELDAVRLARLRPPAPADQGLTPSDLISDAAGDIDYTASSWSASSWSAATGPLSAAFAASSWSCTCPGAGDAAATPSASSWSASSWSQSSWSVLAPGTPGAS